MTWAQLRDKTETELADDLSRYIPSHPNAIMIQAEINWRIAGKAWAANYTDLMVNGPGSNPPGNPPPPPGV